MLLGFKSNQSKLLCVMAAVILASVLTSCGDHAGQQGANSSGPAAGRVNMTPTPAGLSHVTHVVADRAPTEPGGVGFVSFIRDAEVDLEAMSVKLPLFRGKTRDGDPVWYILTDVSDQAEAERLGINFANRISSMRPGRGARLVTRSEDGTFIFKSGSVDFGEDRVVVPGAPDAPFPPTRFHVGALADSDYSPFVMTEKDGHRIVYNAPVLAEFLEADDLDIYCEGNPDHELMHDKVIAICPREGTVTLQLIPGFSLGRPIVYISTDANADLPAALEAVVQAPRLDETLGMVSNQPFERLVAVINGETRVESPRRQGMYSLLKDGLPPLNIAGSIPGLHSISYSPLWQLHPFVWSEDAHRRDFLVRIESVFTAEGLAARGLGSGMDGSFGSAPLLVNCPVIARLY